MNQPDLCIDPRSATDSFPPLIRDTAISLLALALFYAAAHSLLALHCLAIGGAAVVMALQISSHLGEGATFRRRLLAESAALDGSLLQRYLTSQFLVRLGLGIFAFLLSVALLALGRLMPWQHWGVLALDALLLPLLAHLVRRSLAGQVKNAALQVVSGQWPLLILNAGLIGMAFMAVDFFTGAPDTRSQAIGEVFSGGFAQLAGQANCSPVGLACGILEGIDRSAWHIRQVAIPLLPAEAMRYAGWAVTLFGSGIVGAGFTWLLLGAMLPASSPGKRGNRKPQAALAAILAAVAAAAYLFPYAENRLAPLAPAASRQVIGMAMRDPCSGRGDLGAAEQARLSAGLTDARKTATASSVALLRSGTGSLFRAAEANVDRYLDWYYSLKGSNTRLAMAAGGKLTELLGDRLMSSLFPGGLDGPLTALAQQAANDSLGHFEQFGAKYAPTLRASMQSEPCLRRVVDASRIGNFEHDLKRSGSAVTTGAVTGWITWKGIVGQAGARFATTFAARTAARAMAAQAGKVAISRGAGAIGAGGAAAATCAPGGPLAIACGLGVGVATWLGADYVLIKGDEFLNREEHKRELLRTLGELERDLANGLVGAHGQLVNQFASNVNSIAGRLFVPAHDGV